jgi:hypothetical protein
MRVGVQAVAVNQVQDFLVVVEVQVVAVQVVQAVQALVALVALALAAQAVQAVLAVLVVLVAQGNKQCQHKTAESEVMSMYLNLFIILFICVYVNSFCVVAELFCARRIF